MKVVYAPWNKNENAPVMVQMKPTNKSDIW